VQADNRIATTSAADLMELAVTAGTTLFPRLLRRPPHIAPMSDSNSPHSAEFFGEQRDFWWNRDFLDLMAKRWRLREASSLADIGCGLCHWSRLIYPYLRSPAQFVGVDSEPRWIAEAPDQFRRAFPQVDPALIRFAQGSATHLPLPDSSFDVVTCQTVLMHLEKPLDALREMLRVLKPGGLLVCVEPNNLWNCVAFTSQTDDEPVETITQRFEFWLRAQRGRMAASLGNHGFGDLLPGSFAQLGLTEISVHLSDKANPIYPPYAGADQRAILAQEQAWKKQQAGPWDRAGLRRDVLRGGGTEEFFERTFTGLERRFEAEQKDITDGRFHGGFGGVTYLVSGRKPT
jgi:ubiquinone/menaquinone biosynthesis C-methylase UbiE